ERESSPLPLKALRHEVISGNAPIIQWILRIWCILRDAGACAPLTPCRRVVVSKGETTMGLFTWLWRRKPAEATQAAAQAKHQWRLLASAAVEHAMRARYDQVQQQVESGSQTVGLHGTKEERLSALNELTTLALVSGCQHQAVATIRKVLQN